MRHWNKGLAALLAAAVLLTAAAPAALAAETGTVVLRTAEDLEDLAGHCALDSWSRGKTVILEADIDLTDAEFVPIPTFGGIFDGQGHTISGLSLSGSGNVQGLFRYVQEGGVVKDLTVAGTVSPGEFRDTAGGIAGDNRGALLRCAFHGVVKGGTAAGGVAGVNQAGGQIVNCTFSGSVSGERYVGGITGQNLGSVIQCSNLGSINTTKADSTASQEILQETALSGTAADLACWTDVGGVAGYSSGVLQSCRNQGAVGYPHVGYNVGGIAGRQSGCLDGCVNSGTVQGRKDVGGIVGQQEPEVTLLYSESFLERLGGELETLQGLTDRMLEDADSASEQLSAQLQAISGQTRTAQTAAQELSGAVTDWADQSIGQVNDLSARLSRALDQLEPLLGDLSGQLEDLAETAEILSDAASRAEALGQLSGEAVDEIRQALDALDTALEQLRSSLDQVAAAAQELRQALGDEEAAAAALEQLAAAVARLKEDARQDAQNAASHLRQALETALQAAGAGTGAMKDLDIAGKKLARLLEDLSDSADGLHQVIKDLADQPAVVFPSLGTAVAERSDALNDAFSGLLDEADALNNLAAGSAGTLLDDLRAVNAQLGAIADLVRQEGQQAQNTDVTDRVEDVSSRQDPAAQTTGRVSACRNQGTVAGDVDVGGVIGAMAVDLEFDPEDDLTREGDRSLNVFLQTKAVAFDCANTGPVTGKKDYAGGIVGRMDLGRMETCENYADVTSTDGSYVGGIAGTARGSLRACWSKCILSGSHHIGGIAGQGADLVDCRAAIEVSAGSAYVGAIAGETDTDGTVSGNLFVSEALAGIDGISYTGKAEPADFADLCALPDAPADFARVTLTFLADGKVVEAASLPYGGALDALPDIPAREGCSAAWPELDYSHVTASRTVEAIYTPYVSALSDDGEPPRILVSGSFSTGARLTQSSRQAAWTDGGRELSGTAWTVTVSDPEQEITTCTIHFRLPEDGRRWQLWVLDEDGWQRRDADVDNSYLVFSGDGACTTFCVLPGGSLLGPAVLGIAAILLAAGWILFVRRRRCRSRDRAQSV